MDQADIKLLTPSPIGVLATLLIGCFANAGDLSAFIRSALATEAMSHNLPGQSVSLAEMASAVASNLSTHGLVTRDFFLELARIRPRRTSEIWRAAKGCGIEQDSDSGLLNVRSQRGAPRGLVPILASLALLMTIIVVVLQSSTDTMAARTVRSRGDFESLAQDLTVGLYAPTLVITLDPPSTDSLVLKVVSVRMGKVWQVSLSKYRTAESAAREIFLALHLKGDQDIFRMFVSEDFTLCQGGKCYDVQLIVDSIDSSRPVLVKKDEQEGRPGEREGGCVGCH